MSMDFAFVPEVGDGGLERLAELFQRLPNTVVNLTPRATGARLWRRLRKAGTGASTIRRERRNNIPRNLVRFIHERPPVLDHGGPIHRGLRLASLKVQRYPYGSVIAGVY